MNINGMGNYYEDFDVKINVNVNLRRKGEIKNSIKGEKNE